MAEAKQASKYEEKPENANDESMNVTSNAIDHSDIQLESREKQG